MPWRTPSTLAAEPLAYEDDIEEDQVAWRAAKLYQLVVPPQPLATLADMPRPATGRRGSDTLTWSWASWRG